MINNLKMAISDNDLERARFIMINELIGSSYPHEVFTDVMNLAVEYNVFEEHNKERLISDPEKWDEEYFLKLKEKLNKNFSKERFMTAYYVSKKLNKDYRNLKREEVLDIKVCDKYKDFLVAAQIGAAVTGVIAIGIGVLLYRNNKKK